MLTVIVQVKSPYRSWRVVTVEFEIRLMHVPMDLAKNLDILLLSEGVDTSDLFDFPRLEQAEEDCQDVEAVEV